MKVMRNIINRSFTCVVLVVIVLLLPPSYAGDLTIDGDLIVTSNLTVGGIVDAISNRITNLAPPTEGTDAVNYQTMTNYVASEGGGDIRQWAASPAVTNLNMATNKIQHALIDWLNPVSDTDLVAHWPFNANANDYSGEGNDCNVYGATLTNSGRFGGCYGFDGNNDYVDVMLTTMRNMSVCAWFKTSTNKPQIIAIHGRAWNLAGVDWWLDMNAGKIEFGVCRYSGDYYLVVTDETYNDGQWHLVVAILDGPRFSLYVDGTLKKSATHPRPYIENYHYFHIGFHQNQPGDYFEGCIDDMRLFSRALSAGEIRALYSTETEFYAGKGFYRKGVDLDLADHKITNLDDPANDHDAATKAYVDTTVGSIVFSGSFNNLTDVPAGLADGDDDSKWDGGSGGLNAEMGRISLGLGSAATNDVSAFAPANLASYVPPQGNLSMGIYTNRPSI